MKPITDPPRALAWVLTALMAAQAGLGLLLAEQYRDVERIRAAWLGNDWITLGVAVPLLLLALHGGRRGSARSALLRAGLFAYGVYNYAFYVFGAALNAFFPLYVLALVASLLGLLAAGSRLDAAAVAAGFHPRTPVRALGAYFALVAVALTAAWLGIWGAHVFAGQPTPVEPEAFRLVAGLDLSLMVPALGGGGVLLWRRRAWGYVIAAVAGVQGSLYLLALSAGAAAAVGRGVVEPPGELPVWGTLAAATTAATVTLLLCAGTGGRGRQGALEAGSRAALRARAREAAP